MIFIRIITFWAGWVLSAAVLAQTPTYVASDTAIVNASSLTLAQPAGLAQDDVLIAQIAVKGARTVTPPGAPGDWNLVDATSTGGSAMTQAVFWRRVGVIGSEPASYSFSFSASGRAVGAVSAYRNAYALGSPIDVAGVSSSNSASSFTLPTLTTTQANTMLVALLGSSRAATAHGIPTGMTTEQYQIDTSAGPNGVTGSLDEQVQASAGSTGAKTASLSTTTAYVAHLLAVRPVVSLAHYAIAVVSGTVANCDYAQITISGHDASHNLVVPPSGRSLTLSTSTGTGVWQAGPVAGTGAWTPSGANNGSATYVWPGGESSFTVRLRQSAVTSLGINLNDGSAVEAALEDPTITFVNSAFRISNGANAAATIGKQIAGKASNTGFGAQTLYLQAVRTDTTTGACTSLFASGTDVSVQVGAQCNNPASCAQSVTLTSSALSSNSAAFVPNGAYPASMNFRFTTANAEAPFTLSYADAGQITLQFRAALPSPPANQFVSGTSNAFVVRPFGFAFTGASHGTTAASAVLGAAGDNFSMTVGAYRWASGQDANNDGIPDAGVNLTGNGLTPNFAATTTVSATGNLPGIATGTLSRASGAATITGAEWSGGAAAITNWRYSEAGNVFLAASSTSYLAVAGADIAGNSGLDGTGAAGGYVGRFRPKQFAVSAATLTTRSDVTCAPASTFTYMDEQLKLVFTLTAQNAQGGTTQNYNGGYAKLGVTTFSNWALGARSGTTNLTSRIDTGLAPTGSWSNGVASNVTITSAILRATPDNPDGPYAGLQFGIAPVDSDGAAMAAFDLDVDNNSVNERKSVGAATDVRFGRLRLDNAFGPQATRLPVPIRVEYWDAATGRFKTNADDDCSTFAASDIALAFNPSPPTNLASCDTRVEAATVTFAAGVGALALTPPAAGKNGSVLLTPNLGAAAGSYCNAGGSYVAATGANKRYLRGRWNDAVDTDGNANTDYDDDASARGAFGLYGSQPKNFIYFRENY